MKSREHWRYFKEALARKDRAEAENQASHYREARAEEGFPLRASEEQELREIVNRLP